MLIGPSGCGKSTLLRMIAGLESITAGEMYIGEKLINQVAPRDRDIAMVFQSYALYPHMTAYENMAFGLVNRKVPKDEIEKKVMDAAKVLDIENLLDRKPKTMSGGQRQRVALGRAMVREPSVFLLDEPLSNLDAKLRNSMRSEIVKLHKQLQTTFVYVTHDQTEAMTMGDRIVVLKDGFIQQVGTPKELYNFPNNQFVAGFIGTPQINFLSAFLKKDETGFFIQILDNNNSVDTTQKHYLSEGHNYKNLELFVDNPITIGIRPEHIRIDSQGKYKGNIEIVEMLGSESYIHIQFLSQRLVIKTFSEKEYPLGSMVSFDFQKGKEILFDHEQQRIH